MNTVKEKNHTRVKASPFVFPGFIPGTQVSTSAKPEAWVAGMNPAMTLKGIAVQAAAALALTRPRSLSIKIDQSLTSKFAWPHLLR
jgi:hypothetical protein